MTGKMLIESYEVDVPAAATAVSILKSGQSNKACEVWLAAKSTNAADNMLVGNRAGQVFPLLKASPIKLAEVLNRMGYASEYDLSEIFVKAGTNGDDVCVMLVVRDLEGN